MRRPSNETVMTLISVAVTCIVLLLVVFSCLPPTTAPGGIPWEEDSAVLCYPVRSVSSAPVPAPSSDSASSTVNRGPVNINTAGADELITLQGIGPVLAKRIIAFREQNGPFRKLEDLMDVSGIAEGKFSAIKDQICI